MNLKMITNKTWKLLNFNFDKSIVILVTMIIILCFLKIISGLDTSLGEPKEQDYSQLEWENENYKDLGENPIVRVVIMTEGFESIYHKKLNISGLNINVETDELMEEKHIVDEVQYISKDAIFDYGSVKLSSEDGLMKIESLARNYGNPQYEGEFEIYSTEEGLVIVNEIPLESYLRWVVPSEMPTSYELEALKAQAVCARSYAYRQMQTLSYEEFDAHMDDSVNFQVYNNLNTSEKTDQAILETKGQKVAINGKVVTTYFFSTSSGHTTDVRAWKSKLTTSNEYLTAVPVSDGKDDYERDLPWYRWNIVINSKMLQEILELNLKESIGTLKDVVISEKGAGQVALVMEITGATSNVKIEGENAIRKALGSSQYNIIKNDNGTVKGMDLLPSAFFSINKKGDEYYIDGGGLGHGIGMSQNGANEMAKNGIEYDEIINHFYQGVELIQ